VAISPQLPEHNAKIAQRHKLAFDVLSDPGNAYGYQLGLVFSLSDELQEVYRGFGLDLPRFNGDDSWKLPMPARLIVTADGTVRAVEASADYTRRPEPAEIVAHLRQLL
jgi:peroxiredoxin